MPPILIKICKYLILLILFKECAKTEIGSLSLTDVPFSKKR